MSFSKNCVFPQIWWASAYFDRSILFFDRSKIFKYVWESLCQFRSIKTDFRSIELVSNCLDRVSVCFDRSNELVFRSIETRETCFLKSQIGLFKGTFSKSFSNFPLSPTWLRLHQWFFVVFLQDFCKVFVLEGW